MAANHATDDHRRFSAAALILILGLRAVSTYYQKVGFALVGNRVLTRVLNDLFQHIHCLTLFFHTRSRAGDMIVRVIGDIGLLKDVAVTALLPLLGSVLVLVLMGALMFWLNWKLALLALLTLPLYWLPTLVLGRKIQGVSRAQKKRESALASAVSESIGAMQGFRNSNYFLAAFWARFSFMVLAGFFLASLLPCCSLDIFCS